MPVLPGEGEGGARIWCELVDVRIILKRNSDTGPLPLSTPDGEAPEGGMVPDGLLHV